jgi:hypothetical protein
MTVHMSLSLPSMAAAMAPATCICWTYLTCQNACNVGYASQTQHLAMQATHASAFSLLGSNRTNCTSQPTTHLHVQIGWTAGTH